MNKRTLHVGVIAFVTGGVIFSVLSIFLINSFAEDEAEQQQFVFDAPVRGPFLVGVLGPYLHHALAAFKEILVNAPTARRFSLRFSLLPNRYLNRHSFPSAGVTSRYKPFSSQSL